MLSEEQFRDNLRVWSKYNPVTTNPIYTPCERLFIQNNPDGAINLATMIAGRTDTFHSTEDPLSEAMAWFSALDLTNVDVLMVYGVGLGYYYDAVKSWLHAKPNRFLVFLEDDYEVMRSVLSTQRGTEILEDRQAWLFFVDEKGFTFRTLALTLVLKPYLYTTSNFYQRTRPRQAETIHARLIADMNIRLASVEEYRTSGRLFFANFFHNLMQIPSSYYGNALFGKFKNIPAIICGAGPSLAKNIDLLPALRQRALIFAGGTAMNAVNSISFLPHFGVGLDPNPPQIARLIMNQAYTVPYFYRTRMQHTALDLIQGERLYTTGTAGYYIGRWFDECMGIAGIDLSEGWNVINFSVSLAWALGCNPIIFTGLDLAYSDTQSYCPGILNHPLHDRKGQFRTKSVNQELISHLDINGKKVWTQWKWIAEAFWFIQFAKLNPNITFINATEGGIGFTGIPNMTLDEVSTRYLDKEYDLAATVHTAIQNAPMPSSATQSALVEAMNTLRESLIKCHTSLKQIYNILSSSITTATQNGSVTDAELVKSREERLADVANETGYQYLLKGFLEMSMQISATDFKVDEQTHQGDDLVLHKAELDAHCYTILIAACESIIQQMDIALAHSQVEQGILSHPKAPSPPVQIAENDLETIHTFYDDGRVQSTHHFQEGKIQGASTYYGKEGQVLSRSFFQNGLPHGDTHTWYRDGSLHSQQHFCNGLWDGPQIYFFENGHIKSQLHYTIGILNGDVKLCYPSGTVKRTLSFVKGKRHGHDCIWDKDGQLLIEAEFNMDKPHGTARQWYTNGILAKEVVYESDSVHYIVKEWNEDGSLKEIEEGTGDYFDQVANHTGQLAKVLEQLLTQVVSPLVGQSSSQNDALEKLQQELQHLNELQQQIRFESGLDPTNPDETVWKGPTTRKQMEKLIDYLNYPIQQQLKDIQQNMETAIDRLTKKMEPSKDAREEEGGDKKG